MLNISTIYGYGYAMLDISTIYGYGYAMLDVSGVLITATWTILGNKES